jgi:hypothetical protein
MQDQVGSEGRAAAILVRCADPNKQDELPAKILERFPEDQLVFTRDLPEIYATGLPALNVFIKVVVGVACRDQHAGDPARDVHHSYGTHATNWNSEVDGDVESRNRLGH